jgi:phosphoglycolate phosphatase
MLDQMERRVKAVIFDLDGTLIDSAPDIHAAVNKMLSGEGYGSLDLPTVTSFIGRGLPNLVQQVMEARSIPLQMHTELCAKVLKHYTDPSDFLKHPYPGVLDALKCLTAQGTALAICTNKPFDAAQADLDFLGMADFFDAMVGGDTLPVKKPDPAPLHRCLELLGAKAALYVGDSETDYDTAQNAAFDFALFTLGYRKKELSYFKAATRFDDFAKLPGIVEAWAERAV